MNGYYYIVIETDTWDSSTSVKVKGVLPTMLDAKERLAKVVTRLRNIAEEEEFEIETDKDTEFTAYEEGFEGQNGVSAYIVEHVEV